MIGRGISGADIDRERAHNARSRSWKRKVHVALRCPRLRESHKLLLLLLLSSSGKRGESAALIALGKGHVAFRDCQRCPFILRDSVFFLPVSIFIIEIAIINSPSGERRSISARTNLIYPIVSFADLARISRSMRFTLIEPSWEIETFLFQGFHNV